MSAETMYINKTGDVIELKRDQWNGKTAKISNYPGLLDAVKQYTWTYSSGLHPYLISAKSKMSLHKFVLCFLYGTDEVNNMLSNDNIIEHLDNDGLNCIFDNLHIVSADYNKAKAFTIDKEIPSYHGIPHFITDVYYSQRGHYYQMQIFLNDNLFYVFAERRQPVPVEEFFLQYESFRELYIDWLYILGCRESGMFDLKKFHSNRLCLAIRPQIEITEEERDHIIIERDGKYYLNIKTSGNQLAVMRKTRYVNLEDSFE